MAEGARPASSSDDVRLGCATPALLQNGISTLLAMMALKLIRGEIFLLASLETAMTPLTALQDPSI